MKSGDFTALVYRGYINSALSQNGGLLHSPKILMLAMMDVYYLRHWDEIRNVLKLLLHTVDLYVCSFSRFSCYCFLQ